MFRYPVAGSHRARCRFSTPRQDLDVFVCVYVLRGCLVPSPLEVDFVKFVGNMRQGLSDKEGLCFGRSFGERQFLSMGCR